MSQQPEQDFASLLDAFEKEQKEKTRGREGRGEGRDDERGRGGKKSAAPQVGDRVSGTIVGIGEEAAFVDLGGKSEAAIPLSELKDADGALTVSIGSPIEAMVASADDGGLVLRVRAAGQGRTAPEELVLAHSHGLPVEGTVAAVVKGGVEVTVAGVRAFCPISQLELRYVEDPAAYVGRKLSFRITRLEEGRGRLNLVLSRRALLEEEAQVKAAAARANLQVGKVVKGTVTSLASYGAFIDLGGIEGLLHVSELGYGRIEHPQEVLKVGEEIEVQIMKIEQAGGDARGPAPTRPGASTGKPGSERPRKEKSERISLSRRPLLQDPWNVEAGKLTIGTRRRGKVVRLEAFGAFVELAPGVDGLIHVSELGQGRNIRHPKEAVNVGDSIDVAVRAVEPERRRISLVLASGEGGGWDVEAEQAGEPRPSGQDAGPGFGSLGDFFQRKKD